MKRSPVRIPTGDKDTDKAIEEVRRSTVLLCTDPFLSGRDMEVTLVNAVELAIAHRLGRRFVGYALSAPMGATSSGRIVEREPDIDRATIYLTATGYGATITVRIRVW